MENEKIMKILDRLDKYCDLGDNDSMYRLQNYPGIEKKIKMFIDRMDREAKERGESYDLYDASMAGLFIATDYIRDTIYDLKSEYGLIKTDYDKMSNVNQVKSGIQPMPKDTSYDEERSPDDFESEDYDSSGYAFRRGRGDEEGDEGG